MFFKQYFNVPAILVRNVEVIFHIYVYIYSLVYIVYIFNPFPLTGKKMSSSAFPLFQLNV